MWAHNLNFVSQILTWLLFLLVSIYQLQTKPPCSWYGHIYIYNKGSQSISWYWFYNFSHYDWPNNFLYVVFLYVDILVLIKSKVPFFFFLKTIPFFIQETFDYLQVTKIFLSILPYRNFIILDFTFRCMIHLQVIFVYGIS